MPPPKSQVCTYFDKSIDGAKCNLCSQIVTNKHDKGGNISNLFAYLQRTRTIIDARHQIVVANPECI